MINDVGGNVYKDIASGVILLGGVAAIIIAAELSMPAIALLGAVASAGSGVYQAVHAPKKHG